MSYSGAYTPLAINVLGSLTDEDDFIINPATAAHQGTWTPSSYVPGTVTSTTVLKTITNKINTVFNAAITPDVYRSMLLIGAGVCPALGNSRPTSFKPSYPGYGSWVGGSLKSSSYPPKEYPVTGTYSYIHQTYGDYAWITGWPGVNGWQQPTDTYQAAYLPVIGDPLSSYDEYFSHGFIATVARQAYYEMWTDQFDRTHNIVNTFYQAASFKELQNSEIASFINSKTFLSGMYSNMNDLVTSDIAGVNQAFKVWGADLIISGRAIYLQGIANFGYPSELLRNLLRNNVLTNSVKMALLINDLTIGDIDNILDQSFTPTIDQEKKLYDAFLLVKDSDLYDEQNGILYGLNCKTKNITSLADLLNPRVLFPNSYASLTVPRYSIDLPNSKIYDFIYIADGVNSRVQVESSLLSAILPSSLAIACQSFSMSMMQIKNIFSMDIQKFSQVVYNLELPTKDLPLVEQADGAVSSVVMADNLLAKTALGSGNGNTYRQCDFFGAASGYPYIDYYKIITSIINQLPTDNLENIYSTFPISIDAEVTALVIAADAEILNIYNNNTVLCDELNYYWDLIGKQLFTEQRAIPMFNPVSSDILDQVSTHDISVFVKQIEQYALDNLQGQAGPTLEAISDVTLFGGQCLVGMIREARNATRLSECSGDLQNNILPVLNTSSASAVAQLLDGRLNNIVITNNSGGYTAAEPPVITVYPVGRGAKLSAVLAQDGSISTITIVDAGSGYSDAQIEISPPPQAEFPNPPQQNYTDTPDSLLIPPELVSLASASLTVDQAIESVISCNCDCWT